MADYQDTSPYAAIDVNDLMTPTFNNLSQAVPSPFPDSPVPELPPFDSIPIPAHTSTNVYQASFYDPTRSEPLSLFVKRPSGPVSLATGKFTGEPFTGHTRWKQV